MSLTGSVQLIRETGALRELWVPELDRIFPAGPESGELVLIRFESRAATFCFMGKVGRPDTLNNLRFCRKRGYYG